MTDLTNADRAIWAAAALAAFIDQTGPDDDASAISDLITDLGHYCDEHDLDFLDIVARGVGHYKAETVDPNDPNRIDIMPSVMITIEGGASRPRSTAT